MKKSLLAITILTLAVSSLTGCGKDEIKPTETQPSIQAIQPTEIQPIETSEAETAEALEIAEEYRPSSLEDLMGGEVLAVPDIDSLSEKEYDKEDEAVETESTEASETESVEAVENADVSKSTEITESEVQSPITSFKNTPEMDELQDMYRQQALDIINEPEKMAELEKLMQ